MTTPALEVKNLTKKYGSANSGLVAVNNISFTINEGEIVGLLGPNGAGKTTTIQMLLDLTTPSCGEIHYFGKDLKSNREFCMSRINFTSAYTNVQDKLTVKQNLQIYAGLYGVKKPEQKITQLLQLFEIEQFSNQLYWKLSSGEQTRVNLAKSLVNSPRLILMDEPTSSLDPEIVNKILGFIIDLQKKEKVAILYTSHNMEEVTRICDRVIFLDRGKIVATDTPLGLTKMVGEARLILTFEGEQKQIDNYLKPQGYRYKFLRPHVTEILLAEEIIPKVLFGFSKRKIWITDIDIQKPDLEDVFLSIAKGKFYGLRKN